SGSPPESPPWPVPARAAPSRRAALRRRRRSTDRTPRRSRPSCAQHRRRNPTRRHISIPAPCSPNQGTLGLCVQRACLTTSTIDLKKRRRARDPPLHLTIRQGSEEQPLSIGRLL